ncbi:phosphatidate cytidylyltransferase [Helicobacter fennelliae]|uniref:Phosphatidate cytidylyltransferase n=2 Tax=Helicobacter TaxID=209 RepID=T1D057_9HELI|nr:phosphatidate cytidylyltransferase [Helicobacter fennelliae]GAD19560.1 phosphatidate cytidylyltransferase [Helicobacter fennelliae MRY12-0050]STP07862.1 phosphatidate cytidylyltransferase [Helicobacter fennelliae]
MKNLKENFMKDKNRYITALVLICALVALLWINNTILVWLVLGILFLIGLKESLKLYHIDENYKFYAVALVIWILALLHSRPIEVGIVACMALAGYVAYKQNLNSRLLLPFLYPTIPFLALYSVYLDFKVDGIWWLILVIVCCDSGAYFGGKAFGKNKLSPTSPNKTIEGAIIGLALAVIIGSVVGIWALNVNFFISIVFCIIVGVSGIFGDLYESYLKRKAGLKDSGSIFPGHGGVLDRLDALLFGAIAMHFLRFDVWQNTIDPSLIPNFIQ